MFVCKGDCLGIIITDFKPCVSVCIMVCALCVMVYYGVCIGTLQLLYTLTLTQINTQMNKYITIQSSWH